MDRNDSVVHKEKVLLLIFGGTRWILRTTLLVYNILAKKMVVSRLMIIRPQMRKVMKK